MTDDISLPDAGWYPAPDGTATLAWWNGARWTSERRALSAPSSPLVTQAPGGAYPYPHPTAVHAYPAAHAFPAAAMPRIDGIAAATRLGLLFSGTMSLALVGVELFGLSAIRSYIAGDDPLGSGLTAYDSVSLFATILSAAALAVTGILWVIWQYRLAVIARGRTRRTPGWHVGSWFIPVVGFWFPYQNISDLWRAFGRTRPGWQVAWWALWIGGSLLTWVSARLSTSAETFDQFTVAMFSSLLGEIVMIAAVPFAWLLVRGLTQAAHDATSS